MYFLRQYRFNKSMNQCGWNNVLFCQVRATQVVTGYKKMSKGPA